MREITVRIYDDLDFARDGTRTEAAVTLAIGLAGKWTELDLSEANHTLIRAQIEDWMKAGHRPDEEPALPPRKRGAAPGRKIPRESLEWGQRVREFARENDIPYITKTGKYYYSNRLRKAYAEYTREITLAAGNNTAEVTGG